MSREKQIEEMDLVVLNNFRNRYYTEGLNTENGIIADAINNILPILVELKNKKQGYRKQREGKWIKATPYSQEYCNQCGLTPKTIFGKLPPFCPNCGAKMKG